jgi:DNA polymerase elongation subunit (family B)
MVRRDWCGLSKKVSEFALGKILSGKAKETVIEEIADYLIQVSGWFSEKKVGVKDLIITK